MAGIASKVLSIILPKGKGSETGTAQTRTYTGGGQQALSQPNYRDHTIDISTSRINNDSRTLLFDLFKGDPDISATVNSYLTVADTPIRYTVFGADNQIDIAGHEQLDQILTYFTVRNDYSTGYRDFPSLESIAEGMRYAILLRGGIASELIMDKFLMPAEIRAIDTASLKWFEAAPGQYKPSQTPSGGGNDISLDIPTFFHKRYRQNPYEIYNTSPFVSAINTIAARQQVINDLYRIMQKTGYPRIDVTIVEEALLKSAPDTVKVDPETLRTWISQQITGITSAVSNMRPDSAFVHTDSVEAKIINEGGPAKSMDVSKVIEVLNAQNQAALKTMATIIGRGESGVNTASVESRIFSLNADSINGPIADMFSDIFTLCLRMVGYDGYVVFRFDTVELRPATELEPQLIVKQSRMLQDLSLGFITDEEYMLAMYNRLPRAGAPVLSGTGFYDASKSLDQDVSPNSDPVGRAITPEGSGTAKSKGVKK